MTLRRVATLLMAAALLAALPVTATAKPRDDGSSTDVCNERENSNRGGYVLIGGPVDPPPNRPQEGTPMRVGNGNGRGLERAAERSPALRTCEPEGAIGPDPDPF